MGSNISINRRPFGEGLEETALYIARTKPNFDDDERPVRRHGSPPSPREIRLAFAVMQELLARIDDIEPNYCDAATETGRAYQAGLFVARAHQLQMTCLGTPEVIAAGIIIEQIGKFIATRPARKWTQWDERSHLRNISTLLSLGGMSSYEIADKLGCDPRDLQRRTKNDLDAIERIFGHFCKGNKGLRKKWQLPQKPIPIVYNDPCESEKASAAATFACLHPDFDDLSEIFSQVLFD
jgi:hypothetical protein